MATPAPRLPEDILARVHDGERVELPEEGAAVVPIEDLRLLRELEDVLDNEAADAALAEPGPSIPWEDVKARLGAA